MADILTEFLAHTRLLLVLDNVEQVAHAGPTVLEPLLRAAPGVTMLVTSRVPLHLYGEQEFAVPPLALVDPDRVHDLETLTRCESVALFAERAAAANPAFRVTPANARAVVEITARLDGLPSPSSSPPAEPGSSRRPDCSRGWSSVSRY